jgi:hypothetical protein
MVAIVSTLLLLVLLLLPLYDLVKQLSLCSQYFCKTWGVEVPVAVHHYHLLESHRGFHKYLQPSEI